MTILDLYMIEVALFAAGVFFISLSIALAIFRAAFVLDPEMQALSQRKGVAYERARVGFIGRFFSRGRATH